MARLACDGQIVAVLEVAETGWTRAKGLLGRDGLHGAMLITRTSSVHTFGMKFPIEVAFVDASMMVIAIKKMPPNRLAMPFRKARAVVEAEVGSFEKWNIGVGSRLEVRP